MPDGSKQLSFKEKRRFEVEAIQTEPFLTASVKILNEQPFDQKNKELNVMLNY